MVVNSFKKSIEFNIKGYKGYLSELIIFCENLLVGIFFFVF